jgi:hypothetical protein
MVGLARLPRMADFAIWVTAAAPALGWSDDHFMGIYTANREQAHELALDVSPVAAAIQTLASPAEWNGTAADVDAMDPTRPSSSEGRGQPKAPMRTETQTVDGQERVLPLTDTDEAIL